MNVPVPWAIALVLAGVTGAFALIGVVTGGRSRISAAMAHLLHFLGGILTGFLALAFFPAWPLLAFVSGMLAIRAWQSGRLRDVGLMGLGFGLTWAVLLGRE